MLAASATGPSVDVAELDFLFLFHQSNLVLCPALNVMLEVLCHCLTDAVIDHRLG
jgi:hypothetical protein